MNANYIQMTTCAACIALAFGLSGCADETIEQGHGTGNAEQTQGLTFVSEAMMPDLPTAPKSRLAAEEKEDRISFRWTAGDYAYLYCDVTPLGTSATWKKSQQQYGIAVDANHPQIYRSTAFVFPDLKPLYTDSRDDNSYSSYYYPTSYKSDIAGHPLTQITQAMDKEIYGRYSSNSYMHDGSYYTTYASQRAGISYGSYQASYYPIVFSQAGPNSIRVPAAQRQGASGYPDSLAFNGACFVGLAFANGGGSMYGELGYSEKSTDEGGTWHTEYLWSRYTLYTGNASNTADIWRTALPSYVDRNGNMSIALSKNSNYTLWPESHGKLMKLGHKTSYISVLPYNPKGAMSEVSLTRATIQVGNLAINGTYPLTVSGIDFTNRTQRTQPGYKRIVLNIENGGVPIAATREDSRKHPAIITALPGEYTGCSMTLTFTDNGTGITFNHAQNYGMAKMVLREGRNLPLYYKLDIPSFGQMSNTYHMWGASDTYWQGGKEPKAWKFNGTTGYMDQVAGYAQTAGDPRWYDAANPAVDPASLTGNAPGANDVSYVLDQCYWDDQTPYIFDGHLFKGLIWIPVIATGKAAAKDGSDWTLNAPATSTFTYVDKSVHNVVGYFALPALGYWENGQLKDVGKTGRYWLADGDPTADPDKAYSIEFDKDGIKVISDTPKTLGCLPMPVRSIWGY